jgi:hypothetical protein
MELRNEKEFFVCHGVCKGGGGDREDCQQGDSQP